MHASFKDYRQMFFLKDIITHPSIIVGDYSYYAGYYHGKGFEECVRYMDEKDQDGAEKLIIGKFCSIGSGVVFLMGGNHGHRTDWITTYPVDVLDLNHSVSENLPPTSYINKGNTVIGNDVWIGTEAMIMPGVKVGNGAVIAARSVVTKNVKPYSVVAGNPAELKKYRFNVEQIKIFEKLCWWNWDIDKIKSSLNILRSGDIHLLEQCSSIQSDNGFKKIIERFRQEFFLAPDGNNYQQLIELFKLAVCTLISHQGDGPIYSKIGLKRERMQVIQDSELPESPCLSINSKIMSLFESVQGAVKAGNQFMVKNIIPVPSTIHIAVNAAVSLLMANAVTGEDAGLALDCELECVSALSKLAGYNHMASGGVFTFGGSGTNLYAFKMALAKLDPDSRKKGINTDAVIIGSLPAHFSHKTACFWLGIGEDNYIQVRSNLDLTTDLVDLEKVCRKILLSGKRITCLAMAGGTTSCMGIDNFKSIYNIRDRLVREFKLNYTPHIHADSVIGWVYLNFIGYDYKNNSLGFNSEVLCKLKGITQRIKTIKFADSFGVDFHKTGYMPYVSSIVIVKDRNDLLRLSGDPKLMTPLFHDDKAYNPGKYTLETSRSVSNIVATWYTLQMIGKDGFRSLLGHAQELSMYLRKKIHSDQSSMVVVNEETLGSDVFIKVYPDGINAKEAFKKELEDINLLKKAEIYNTQFFNWLTLNKYYGNEAIAISKTSAAFYTNTGHPVQALRIYILNPYITKETIDLLITFLASAKSEYDLSLKKAMHGEVIEQFSSQGLKSTGVQSDYVECNLSNVTVTKVADKQIIGGSYYGK